MVVCAKLRKGIEDFPEEKTGGSFLRYRLNTYKAIGVLYEKIQYRNSFILLL